MHRVPAPDVRELLLPILSCLPTAFLSPRPPPALLPILSPILRQRITLLSSQTTAQPDARSKTTWLNYLTWSPARAARLADIVGHMQLEPHPVSGELEIFDDSIDPHAGEVLFRRLDAETLQAKCEVKLHRVAVIWVWCVGDTGGVGLEAAMGAETPEASDGWRVAEVRPSEEELETLSTGEQEHWYPDMGEAEEAYEDSDKVEDTHLQAAISHSAAANSGYAQENDNDNDDDDYWASYDRTPGKTPGGSNPISRQRSAVAGNVSEADYFARYGDVQPALDGHDPEEAKVQLDSGIESTLGNHDNDNNGGDMVGDIKTNSSTNNNLNNGNNAIDPVRITWQAQDPPQRDPQPQSHPQSQSHSQSYPQSHQNQDPNHNTTTIPTTITIESPSPSRPHSHSSDDSNPSIEALEEAAAATAIALSRKPSVAMPSQVVDAGVLQHVGHEIKALFRLAQSVGVDRLDFERVVRTELDMLGLTEL